MFKEFVLDVTNVDYMDEDGTRYGGKLRDIVENPTKPAESMIVEKETTMKESNTSPKDMKQIREEIKDCFNVDYRDEDGTRYGGKLRDFVENPTKPAEED